MAQPDLILRPAHIAEAATLAGLMVDGLDSRLNDLGPWFVTYLHRHMVVSPHCLCLVAERGGQIAGYGSVLTSTRHFYREFMLRKGAIAALIVLPWLLRPHNLHTAWSALTYSNKAPHNDPDAELVSLIVVPTGHRSGVGTALFRALVDGLRERNISALKITTGTDNQAANAFYQKYGCEYLRSEPLYDDAHLNVYRYGIV